MATKQKPQHQHQHSHQHQTTTTTITNYSFFEVPGAAAALRGMWPLVFAREEGVRASVLDAWHRLYLDGADARKQVCGRVGGQLWARPPWVRNVLFKGAENLERCGGRNPEPGNTKRTPRSPSD